jgi:lipopolysaccharide export system permease protein
MTSLVDRYLLREWIKAMFVFVLMTLGILVLEDMYKNLKMFLEREVPWGDIATYYCLLLPNFFYTVIPVSFFVSLLFMLSHLHGHNEIVALRASGLTIFRITRVLWAVAFVLVGLLSGFNAYLLPYCSEKVRTMVEAMDFDEQKKRGCDSTHVGVVPFLPFYHWRHCRLWWISRFSLYSHRGRHTVVFQLDRLGRERGRIQANEIRFDNARHEWIFYDGYSCRVDPQTGEIIRREQFHERYIGNFSETPELMYGTTKLLKRLSFHELKCLLKEFPERHKSMAGYAVKYYSVLSTPFICLMALLLAIPFSLKDVRANPIVGVSEAVVLFFVYYVVNSLGQMLGIQGLFPPLLSAWLPNVFMLSLGGLFYLCLAPK